MVKFDTGDNVTLLQTKPSLLSCYRSCNDVVKFDTGDNVTLLQTKPSLLCHQHMRQCTGHYYKQSHPYCYYKQSHHVTGVVMMW